MGYDRQVFSATRLPLLITRLDLFLTLGQLRYHATNFEPCGAGRSLNIFCWKKPQHGGHRYT